MTPRAAEAPTAKAAAGDWKARLELVISAGLFSTGGAVIKGCSLAPLQIAGLRSLLAAFFLVLVWRSARRGFAPRQVLFGVLYAATLLLFVAANKLTTSANAIYLQSTAPLWVLLLAPAILKERVRKADVVLMLALAGGLWLCFQDALASQRASVQQATAPRPLLGNVFAVVSGVSWGGTILALRWLSRSRESSGETVGGGGGAASSIVLGNVICFAACVLLARPLGEPFFRGLDRVAFADVRALLFLGCVQVGLAYVLLARGMRQVTALEASLLLLVEPVFNPVWTFLVHREEPGKWALAGGGVILGATALHALFASRTAPRTMEA